MIICKVKLADPTQGLLRRHTGLTRRSKILAFTALAAIMVIGTLSVVISTGNAQMVEDIGQYYSPALSYLMPIDPPSPDAPIVEVESDLQNWDQLAGACPTVITHSSSMAVTSGQTVA